MGNKRVIRWNEPKPPTEEEEQITLIEWAAMMSGRHPELKTLIHIPNGGSRNKAEAAKLKAMGVRAGVSDLFLPVARGRYHGLWIEMKRRKGGKMSDEQTAWIRAMRAQGYAAEVVRGAGQAMELIMSYLELVGDTGSR